MQKFMLIYHWLDISLTLGLTFVLGVKLVV